VVLKLFLASGCGLAVFGEKDFQQLAVIRRMVRDLNVPVKIIGHPTVREPDGLALSSRNSRLTPAQRADAPRLRHALLAARAAFTAGSREAAELREIARRGLDAAGVRLDYLELVDAESLQAVARVDRPAVLATAVFYGEVRLIDHLRLEP
jgi:pantoate--beta-alanine ligase